MTAALAGPVVCIGEIRCVERATAIAVRLMRLSENAVSRKEVITIYGRAIAVLPMAHGLVVTPTRCGEHPSGRHCVVITASTSPMRETLPSGN